MEQLNHLTFWNLISHPSLSLCNRVEKFLILPKNQNSSSHSFLRECVSTWCWLNAPIAERSERISRVFNRIVRSIRLENAKPLFTDAGIILYSSYFPLEGYWSMKEPLHGKRKKEQRCIWVRCYVTTFGL